VAQAKELRMAIGYVSVQRELPALLAVAATGRLDTTGIVTHRLGLADGVEAYAMLAARADGVGKILLDPRR
jgi:alcohol dehydrogenase